MEAAKERMIAQLELETQEYSVFITDEKRTSSGSGVLFYPGSGNRLYIFTCAHVWMVWRSHFRCILCFR